MQWEQHIFESKGVDAAEAFGIEEDATGTETIEVVATVGCEDGIVLLSTVTLPVVDGDVVCVHTVPLGCCDRSDAI
jgi:hypothetical protein